MPSYPPAPPGNPGGWGSAASPYDPYGAERALQAWAADRKLELITQPDIAFYLSWYPFQYLPRLAHVTREVRAKWDEARVFVAECYDSDPLRQAMGEQRRVIAFVVSPKLRYRVAIRSKSGGGIGNDIERGIQGLGSLFGSSGPPPGAILGDPTLEHAMDVVAPSREEGNLALPPPLRQILVQSFRGILEPRPRGMVVTYYDYSWFEPRCLDAVLHMVGTMLRAATPPEPTG